MVTSNTEVLFSSHDIRYNHIVNTHVAVPKRFSEKMKPSSRNFNQVLT